MVELAADRWSNPEGRLTVELPQTLAAGGSVVVQIFAFPGGRRFHFRDPAGSELAVWSEG